MIFAKRSFFKTNTKAKHLVQKSWMNMREKLQLASNGWAHGLILCQTEKVPHTAKVNLYIVFIFFQHHHIFAPLGL